MVKCTFCGNTIPQGTGKMFVKLDGKIIYFCSRKCEKNMIQLKRKPLKTKWTEHHKKQTTKKSKGTKK